MHLKPPAYLSWSLAARRQIDEAGTGPRDGVMVCGDSGNDVELFAVPGVRGCMVVNAHPELRKWCDAHAAPSLFQVRVTALLH